MGCKESNKQNTDNYYTTPILKGTATLMISRFYQKELFNAWILIQVSSKSVEKCGSNGHLKNSIQPSFSRHFEYLISFQIFFQLFNF